MHMGLTISDEKSETRGRKPLSQGVIEYVAKYYNRDDVSRQAPGMRDCKKIDGEFLQKRHMYSNINETYELYRLESDGDMLIGRSKFAELRPRNIFPLEDMPQNVCVCAIHENVLMCITVLARCSVTQVLPISGRELVNRLVCLRTETQCMNLTEHPCLNCSTVVDLYEPVIGNMNNELNWFQWGTVDKKVQKIKHSGSVSELIDTLHNQWKSFLTHCYVKDVQGSHFEKCKQLVSNKKVVVQVDFSENYQTFHQDEIQSAHWAYNQVTLFTSCVWTDAGVKSVCLISDYLSHDKYAVHIFMNRLFGFIKSANPSVSEIVMFSDGSAAQFKNRFLFSNLFWFKKEFELDNFEWNFFATSHGKGPVDGLGGALKRSVRRGVLSRKFSVADAQTFANACKGSTAKIIVVSPAEIEGQKAFLDQRWILVGGLKGTQQVHHVVATHSYAISYSRVSKGMPIVDHDFMAPNSKPKTANDNPPMSLDSEIDSADLMKPGDFVKVSLSGKKSTKLYIGMIKERDVVDSEVQFMRRRKPSPHTFVIKERDISWVANDSLTKISCPTLTNRNQYNFVENLIEAE